MRPLLCALVSSLVPTRMAPAPVLVWVYSDGAWRAWCPAGQGQGQGVGRQLQAGAGVSGTFCVYLGGWQTFVGIHLSALGGGQASPPGAWRSGGVLGLPVQHGVPEADAGKWTDL